MEIDERVVSVSKEYLPSLASYTAHPKATLHFMDAFQWVKTQANASMDIVIVDLLDLTESGNLALDYMFETNTNSRDFDKLNMFVQDLHNLVGTFGAICFQLGEEQTPTACSLENVKLYQLEQCAGLRRQLIMLQILRKHFSFTHVYSVYINSWRGMWSMVLASNSELVEQRFSRTDVADIALDIHERTIQSYNYFREDALLSFQIHPMAWAQIDDIMFDDHHVEIKSSQAALTSVEDDTKEQEVCPQIKQIAPNNEKQLGFTIPYRLGESTVAPSGVGVFTLKNIKRGDVIWQFSRELFLFLTNDNWLPLVEDQVRRRNWKGAPDLDDLWVKAVQRGWDPNNQTLPVMKELIRALLMRDWINDWPIDLLPAEDQTEFARDMEESLQAAFIF